jgi:hypothetical protein
MAVPAPSVTLATPAPDRTAWMPQPCRKNNMNEASMQYEQAADRYQEPGQRTEGPSGATDMATRRARPFTIKTS